MSEPVDFFLSDSFPPYGPIAAAIVKVFSADGRTAFDQAEADADGHAAFLLAPGLYQARFYKQQVKFKNPLLFQVLLSPGENSFDVTADLAAPPTPTDPRLCTAYGYFRTATGEPARGINIEFVPMFKPLLLDGAAVGTERAFIRTNEDGYGQLNLIRLGQYSVTMQGFEDYSQVISVPDLPNTSLPDLLFPVVSLISLNPPGPYVMDVGEEIWLNPTVIASNGQVLPGPATEDVSWKSSAPLVLMVIAAGNKITLRGVGPGVASILVVRANYNIIRYPDLPIAGQPIEVLVNEV